MQVLKKSPDKDFIVLNITDPQLSTEEWADGHLHRKILEKTVTELIERVKPDLITISGDLAWAGQDAAYDALADFIDSFQIPWSHIWGNHDNQNGPEFVDRVAERYLAYPNCLYEKGDPALGNGNYILSIEENGKPVAAFIMLDSHDKSPFTDENGVERAEWAKLYPEQGVWLNTQLNDLKAKGCFDVTILLHIPIYAYRLASNAAYKAGLDLSKVTLAQADGNECWNEGYTNSIGVQYEAISSYPADDGIFPILQASGIVKRVLAGHDHVINWMIDYEGIQLIYGLKAGAGCYWNPLLNGGTVLKINETGVYETTHQFVDVADLL